MDKTKHAPNTCKDIEVLVLLIYRENNMKGTAYPSGAHEFTLGFLEGFVLLDL
jgi:hypothetical protein